MASKFLSEEEFDIIQKICESKGVEKFHLIAFNTDDLDVPRYLMASGFASYHDLFAYREILKVVNYQLDVMCKSVEEGKKPHDVEEVDGMEVIGEPIGNC